MQGGVILFGDANKIEFMCFKQEGTMFILRGKPRKFIDQFAYLGTNISSTESNTNILLVKA